MAIAFAVAGAALAGGAAAAAGATAATIATVAELGFMVGEAIGSMIMKPRGPQAPDLKIQSSAYGRPIPIMCGGSYRIAGNVIWAGEAHEHDIGGKKGPSQTGVTISLGVALCEGVIKGVSRIWFDNKLVYDVTDPNDTVRMTNAAKFAANMTVYLGTTGQNPDPTMTAHLGAGNVPGYRGLAYVVWNELNLVSWGNVIPSMTFEVVKDGTSTPVVYQYESPYFDVYNMHVPASPDGLIPERWIWDYLPPGSGSPEEANAVFVVLGPHMQVLNYINVDTGKMPSWTGYGGVLGCWYCDDIDVIIAKVWDGASGYFLCAWSTLSYAMLSCFSMPNTNPQYSFEVRKLHNLPYYFTFSWNSSTGVWTVTAYNNVSGAVSFTDTVTLPSYRGSLGYAIPIAYADDGGGGFFFTSGNTLYYYSALGHAFYARLTGSAQLGEVMWDSNRNCLWVVELGKEGTVGDPSSPHNDDWLRQVIVPGPDGLGCYFATTGPSPLIAPSDVPVTSSWAENFNTYPNAYNWIDTVNDVIWHGNQSSADTTTDLWAMHLSDGSMFRERFNGTVTPGLVPGDRANGIAGIQTDSEGASIVFQDIDTIDSQYRIVRILFVSTVIPNATTLDQVVQFICEKAGLQPTQFDVTDLENILVYGYCLTNHSSMRDNLQPLMSGYLFDCADGGELKFVRRGKNPLVTVPFGDVGAVNGIQPVKDPISETIKQEVELPRVVSLTYQGRWNDYQPSNQQAFKRVTDSNLEQDINMPFVLDDNDALGKAQAMLWEAWVGRRAFSFVTSLKYLTYDPADVITITGRNGQQYTIRLIKQTYDGKGLVKWDAISEDPNIYPSGNYTAQGGTPLGYTPQALAYAGLSAFAVIDGLPLRSGDNPVGVYIAAGPLAEDASWPGVDVEISRDNTNYTDLQRVYSAAAMGTVTAGSLVAQYTTSNLRFGYVQQVDEASVLTVQMQSGSLASVTRDQMLAGANAALVNGELVFFQNAVLVGTNTYQVSTFVRHVGNQQFTVSTAGGIDFIVIDPATLVAVPLASTDLGNHVYFEPRLLNLNGSTPDPETDVIVSSGRARCVAPAGLTAVQTNGASSDINLTWFRCARSNYGLVSGADVALDESTETYTLTVEDHTSTVKRTVTVTGPFTGSTPPNFTYTAAMATADGLTGSGTVINFYVSQNSDQGVAGDQAFFQLTR